MAMPDKHDKTLLDRLNEAVLSYDADDVAWVAKALVAEDESSLLDPDAVVESIRNAAAAGNYRLVSELSDAYASRLRADPVSYPKTFASELTRAVDTFDKARAAELCGQLVQFHRSSDDPYPLSVQDEVLYVLQRKRYFDLMIDVGDTLILCNGAIDDRESNEVKRGKLKVRRRYTQALIDGGQLSAALDVLAALERDCEVHDAAYELVEVRGLIGRARKQFYMDFAVDPEHAKPTLQHKQSLADAVTAYGASYELDQTYIWHGINTVALVARAGRDRVPLRGKKWSPKQTAQDILSLIARKEKNKNPKDRANLWDFATAAESCLALGKYGDALKWVTRYTDDSQAADAFEYASTLRQFEEVWQLDNSKANQAKILQLLRAALLQKDGGKIELRDPVQEVKNAEKLATDVQFEKVLGQDRYKTYRWYVTGLERSTSVAKVHDRVGNGVGTGFLVKGPDIHPSMTQDWVFVTNAHVISDDPAEQSASPPSLAPEDATVIFEAGPDAGKEFAVDRLLFTSKRTELDCTVVALAQSPSFDKPFRIAKSLPRINPERSQRVYVIGHPKGGRLSFSLHDNVLLDHEVPKVHYRAPTEGGSSGSPVFNANWDLVALHHSGGESMPKLNNQPGVYGANEGIAIQSILQAIALKLG